MIVVFCCLPTTAQASDFSDKYDERRPLIIVGDWDKPPYEFLNDDGEPAGTNVDLMRMLCNQLGVHCQFMLKEWSGALKTFERGHADIILANIKRFKNGPYACSENIINYNRICAATCCEDSVCTVTTSRLLKEGVVLKSGDYTGIFFRNLDTLHLEHIEFQSPKVALQGLQAGDYQFFCWGEEPLKWKIRELHLEGITLCDVDIPVSEIHIVGHDKELIYQLDDLYSRLKQSGEVQRINDRWLHPEKVRERQMPRIIVEGIIAIFLAVLLYILARLAKVHVRRATRESTEISEMMQKALEMGNFHIMVYDIHNDLMQNRYGTPILPDEGITLQAFTNHIHHDEREEFERKMKSLLTGHERKFELKKRWKAYGDGERWLNLDGHAMVELDGKGQPAYIVNAIHDVTSDEENDKAIYEIGRKYERLSNTPFLAMSFYDREGWLIDINDKMKEICGITPENPDAQRFWTTISMFDIPLFRNVYKPGSKEDLQAGMYMKYSDIDIDRCVEYYVQPLFDAKGQVANYYVTTIDLTFERNMHKRLMQLRHEQQDTMQQIELHKRWLAFMLQNSDRYIMHCNPIPANPVELSQSDSGRIQISFFRQAGNPDFVHDLEDFCQNYLLDADCQTFRDALASTSPQQIIIHLKKHSLNQPGTVFQVSVLGNGIVSNAVVGEASKLYSNNVVSNAVVGEASKLYSNNVVSNASKRCCTAEAIITDITVLDKARQQLTALTSQAKDSVKMKSGFMASMTHELRTPLNAIIGFTSILEVLEDPTTRAEYVRIIQNSSDMLQRLISDITQASSMIEGPTSIERAPVDFAKAFDDICFTVQYRIQNPDITFIKAPVVGEASKLCGPELILNVDVGRIQQVITNFVTNAIKFTKQGYIRLGYRIYEAPSSNNETTNSPNDQTAILYVFCEDTGMGIPKDKQRVIFDRFVKLDEFVQGTGMGLAICKSIVEHMGGTIGVDSPGLGKGSTFWFRIPLDPPST